MMAAQPFPAQHLGMQHPGMPHGPQMGGPGQHPGMGGPGPGMMHPGVSGVQVSQGPMVTGMPPGAPTPAPGGPMPNAHAMSHLGPQQHMFQQGHPQMGFNPMLQQQHMMRRQQMLQAQMQGQHGHIPVTMPNGAQGMNPAQIAAMQVRHMPTQQGMQQFQQLQAQAAGGNQQQMQNPQHQQMLAAQHAAQAQFAAQQALQQQQQQQHQAAQAAQARNNQMMQDQNPTTQPPPPQPTPAPQAAPQPQPTPQPQTSQPTSGPQPQPPQQPQQQQQPPQPQQAQQPQQQNPNQPQQAQQPQGAQPGQQSREQSQAGQDAQLQQQKANAAALMMQQQQQQARMLHSMKGASILRVIQYCDYLGSPEPQQAAKLKHWQDFVTKFFADTGVLRQQLWNSRDSGDKRFQLGVPALARFYWTHFTSGVKHINMHLEGARENDLSTGGHTVEGRVTITYIFDNDSRLISSGTLKAHLDAASKIDLLDLGTKKHVEYVPRPLIEASINSPDQKTQSPEFNKKLKRTTQPKPVGVSLPLSQVNKEWGITNSVLGFLELAETLTSMDMLFAYCQDYPSLRPAEALEQLVQTFPQTVGIPVMNPAAMQGAMQGMPPGQRTPSMNGPGPNAFSSPAMAHLGLPQQGSPHIGAVHTPSPHQNHMGGPVAMAHQQSQQGSTLSGSQGTSANTSPNVTNKKRRASAVKLEGDDAGPEVNGVNAQKVKASPRVGGKRQKGTA